MAKASKAVAGRAKAKPGKTKKSIDWDKIRAEYEVGGPENSVRAVAGRHGVTHPAILKRAAKEKWAEPGDLDETIRRRVTEKVTGLVTAGNPKTTAEAVDAEAERRAAVVQRHRAEWEEIEQLRQEVLEARLGQVVVVAGQLVTPEGVAFGKAKLLKIMTEATSIKQTAQRKAWGLDANGGAPGNSTPVTTFRIAPLE